MDTLYEFCSKIRDSINGDGSFSINQAREVVTNINSYLYTNYPGIGYTEELGREFEYLSDFHKFWKAHHREVLDCTINDKKCSDVADILHSIYQKTNGEAFREIYDAHGLDKEAVCRVRFLTANQDFRGSLDFGKLADIYISDNCVNICL